MGTARDTRGGARALRGIEAFLLLLCAVYYILSPRNSMCALEDIVEHAHHENCCCPSQDAPSTSIIIGEMKPVVEQTEVKLTAV